LTDPGGPILPAGTFTGLGYQFLQRGQIDQALVVFNWGVTAFPTQANAWDSYGEACAANSEFERALTYYRKAQELIPDDTSLTPAFRQILETNIPPIIEQLEQQLADRQSGDN
jgi:tetratricopeptide (TPR) repeat protein